jgi:hypothetical protein
MEPEAARARLLDEHRGFVERVLDCGRAVAAGWEGSNGDTDGETSGDAVATTPDRSRVVPPSRAALDRAGLLDRAPGILRSCVAAAGGDLQANPVAAPPYVVVTSTGLVLRATLPDGRLVVRIEPFAVDRAPTRYRLRAVEPAAAVSVERR